MNQEQLAEKIETIKLGISSALAIFKECEITVPFNHPDPGAIKDCIKNVHDAYDEVIKVAAIVEAMNLGKGNDGASVQKDSIVPCDAPLKDSNSIEQKTFIKK